MIPTIRRATEADLPLVSSVLNEAAAWLAARNAAIWHPDELAAAMLAPDVHAGFYYLALQSGEALQAAEAAGVMRLTSEDPLFWPEAAAGEALYVHRLAVRRTFAGATVSQTLLRFAAAEAKRRRCPALRLDCIASRPKLRALYERFGFRFHSERHVGPYHVARYELPL
jgi:GNAT superfamily N-acetyltransferase